jgi:glycosyltransferase involved in cell wall biosynthesis
MPPPFVSIIAISYNHAPFIQEALFSILQQDYPNIELIVVDDASIDKSQEAIKHFFESHQVNFPTYFIFHQENQGNCKSFNEALALCKGRYIIDFALDDVMLPERIGRQVVFFEQCSPQTGIIFSNAEIIAENGDFIKYHYALDSNGTTRSLPPQGKVFRELLAKHFICPPTMMMRKTMLSELGGYDESLAYEDFDLWIRASQNYEFAYQDFVSTRYRQSQQSLSQKFYQKKQNPLLHSTLIVLEKAFGYCKESLDFKVLVKNIEYHQRQCFYSENFELLEKYSTFLQKSELKVYRSLVSILISLAGKIRFRVSFLYAFYLKIKKSSNLFL